MMDWKKVHSASQPHIHARAASGLFVAAIYVVIGIFGLALLTSGQLTATPIGVLFLAVGAVGCFLLGRQVLRDYYGNPVVLTVRVLRKHDAISYSRTGMLHRYYLILEVNKAFNVAPSGDLVDITFPRWETLPASNRLFAAVNEGETTVIVCTPAGYAFATLDELR